jgi:RimJ/RimL family protein N-acetyltransferase
MKKISIYSPKNEKDLRYISFLYSCAKNTQYLWTKKMSIKEVKNWLDSSRNKIYILSCGNSKIGCFNLKQNINGKEIRIGIIIDAPYRGKGYGKLALKIIENEAKKLGAKKFSLETFSRNKRAIGFFKKAGYKTVEKLILMEKEE